MREKIKTYINNSSIRKKYLTVFLGVTLLSYLWIVHFANTKVQQYEKENIQHFMSASMEQAKEVIQYETYMVENASEAMYYNQDVYLALNNCLVDEAHQDPGQEYRYWLMLSNSLDSLQTGNICNVCIYAPESYIYNESNTHFAAISEAEEREAKWLDGKGERAVWTTPYLLRIPKENTELSVISYIRRVVQQNDYGKTLCLEQVSIPTEVLNRTLENADNSREGCILLMNQEGEVLASSGTELSEKFQEELSSWRNAEKEVWKKVTLSTGEYFIYPMELLGNSWKLMAAVPLSELNRRAVSMRNTLMLGMIPMMLFCGIFIYVFASHFSDRIKKLSHRMEHWKEEKYQEESLETGQDEIGVLNHCYQEMLGEIDGLMKQQYKNGIAIKDAELRALQAQINPHFLYNTLDLINWEAREKDAPEIGELVQMMARYSRAVLSKGQEEVSLKHELDHIETYTGIQNIRFDSRIHLKTDVPEELLNRKLPKMTLQPLVENSILHGIPADDDSFELTILVTARKDGSYMDICVSDNGRGMDEETCKKLLQKNESDSSSHYAVFNVHERLQIRYGRDSGLHYESEEGKGTKVKIRIPEEN